MSTSGLDQKSSSLSLFVRHWWPWITVLIMVTTAAITYWQFYVTCRATPTFQGEIIERKCLTRISDVVGLCGVFQYKDREVHDLWEVQLRLSNGCGRNIIGTGPNTDLLRTNIGIVPEGAFNVLAAEFKHNGPNARLQMQTNDVYISFDRWRPEQSLLLCVYCERRERGGRDAPSLVFKEEPLTQGDSWISCGENREEQKNYLLEFFPKRLQLVLRWYSIVFYALFLVVLLLLVFGRIPWIALIRFNRWIKLYGSAFQAAFNDDGLGATESYDARESPFVVDESFWGRHGIPKPSAQKTSFRGVGSRWADWVSDIVLGICCLIAVVVAECSLIPL